MYSNTARRHRPAIIRLITCGVLLQLSLHALAAGRIADIDFTLGPRGHLLLPVTVDGREQGVFALDTGATSSVLTPEFADRLGPGVRRGASMQTHGAHESADVQMVEINSLQVGEVSAEAGQAIIMDLSHINGQDMSLDGIVGNSFLDGFDVVIDFPRGKIELLEPGSLAASGTDFSSTISIAPGTGALIYLDVVVGGQPMIALLDTGSGRSAINSAGVEALGLQVPPMPDDAAGHPQHAPAIPNLRVELGEATLSSESPVHIVDLGVFETLGLAERPTLLLGTNLLRDRRLGIDYASRRIYF